jgi:DNA segregation ATPase FtsK/SpoIIIE-like protein
MTWKLPPNDLFARSEDHHDDDKRAAKDADVIVDCLDRLGAHCECERWDIGPQVIRYSLVAAEGVSVRQIPRLERDLEYEIGSPITVHAPARGERFISIETPNLLRRPVLIGDVL